MTLLRKLSDFVPSLFLQTLNIGGVGIIALGICTLPVHFSYRLITLGIFMLLSWHAFTKN